MAVYFELEMRESSVMAGAKSMMIAARTAPKAKGMDYLEIAAADREEIKKISAKLLEMVKAGGPDFFARDAECILKADAMLLIGTKIEPLNIPKCGQCGHANCDEKKKFPSHPCSFNTGDLGIAIGSAVSVAAGLKIDSRVLFSAGAAAKELNILGDEVKIVYAIPLSASSKNPFFDRVWPKK
jgi:uncharacterized ferredoxin-like protein